MEGQVGFEPTQIRLTNERSENQTELLTRKNIDAESIGNLRHIKYVRASA